MNYPKNRKGVSGRPFPRANEHKLKCIYCGKQQKVTEIRKLFKSRGAPTRISQYCEGCLRGLTVYKSKNGYFRIMNNYDRRRKWVIELLKQQAHG